MDRPSRKLSTWSTNTSSTSGMPSFFTRSLTKSDTSQVDEQPEQAKGALGLTTLHVPEEHVLSDLIFVHGLNGGSESTWSRTDGTCFWPQQWLREDDAFKNVRIHTFGYSSGLHRESVLNIQDFAASLLSAIQDSPAMGVPEWGDVPLVFVGHSMGGLVIKKAFILGCQNPAFEPIVNRVRAVLFLATPHQGADMANTLSRLLSLFPGSRPSVDDLLPQSPVLQGINEEFPRYCNDLQLFSFYETRQMYYGTGKGLIVEKNCAVMNYPNERRTYLEANHRDCARFLSKNDFNYISVRNALATLTDTQRRKSSILEQEREQLLAKFLGVQNINTDDVLMQYQRRLQGSGVWLLERQKFKQWRDALSSQLMWLRGRPGAGKSFLAGTVVKHLRKRNHDCCAFSFATADNAETTASAFFRSMAFQMARAHPEIANALSDMMAKKDTSTDKNDHNSLWRSIYLSGILKLKLNKQQYWIIDAMDECKAAADIMSFLGKAQVAWPLCIFVTSRNSFESTISRANPDIEVILETITDEDSNRGITVGPPLASDCELRLEQSIPPGKPSMDELARLEPVEAATRVQEGLSGVPLAETRDTDASLVARLTKELMSLFRLWNRQILPVDRTSYQPGTLLSLQRSSSRLKIWSDGYGIADGAMDDIFVQARKIRRATLTILRSIGRTLVGRIPGTLNQQQDETPETLSAALERVTMLNEAAREDRSEYDSSDDSESDYDPESLEEVAKHLQTDTVCLMELDPLLRSPVLDVERGTLEGADH